MVPAEPPSTVRLVDSLLAKLKKPVYVATAQKYLDCYGFSLKSMKIDEHLASELKDAPDKRTYTQQRNGIKKLFQGLIYGNDELSEVRQAVYMTKVVCLLWAAPKFAFKAEYKRTLDHLYSSLFYCGLIQGKLEHLEGAFVLQALYLFGVHPSFFEELTFECLKSDEALLELANKKRLDGFGELTAAGIQKMNRGLFE